MYVNPRGFRLPLDALLTYSENCRELLRHSLLAHPGVFDKPIKPAMIRLRSIRHITAHMAAAEQRWIQRRILGREVPDYDEVMRESVEEVFEDWRGIRAATCEYLGTLNPESYRRMYTVGLSTGWIGSLTIEQILFHIFNHETHHRAQISMALQQFGIDPPEFDYVLLK